VGAVLSDPEELFSQTQMTDIEEALSHLRQKLKDNQEELEAFKRENMKDTTPAQ
jgi:hypothetical protein